MARLYYTALANEQVEVAAAWWAANRSRAPGLFVAELRQAFDLIVRQPQIGAPAADVDLSGVRRLLIGRSRCHVYYRQRADGIEVVAVWHTSRRGGPRL